MEMLKDRVAVVTGAGRGIGRAICELFVAEGARVLINDIDSDVAQQSVRSCETIGGKACAASVVGSVADSEFAVAMMTQAFDTFGSVDILVNNAGLTDDAMAHKMSDETWKRVLDVNLGGTFNCCRATVPYMRNAAIAEIKDKGEVSRHRKIVNFYSTAAINGNVGQINYAAAKMGNVGLTRTLAREWGPFRINVNAVAPGFTDTRLTRPKEDGDGTFGIPSKLRDQFIDRLPFGRPASPLDVAKVVLFFASPLSDWVTGQEINCSGGHQIP